jgi:protein SCO1/2
VFRAAAIATAIAVAAVWWLRPAEVEPTAAATVLPQSLPLPAFDLVDHMGRPFGRANLDGQFTLMFFGFTNCPDVCPLTLKTLADARAEILRGAPSFDPAVVFVSVDPARDDSARIASYLQRFDPTFVGVTGTDEALAPLITTLGVTVQKHSHGDASYNVVHNSTVYVIDPRGELIAVSSAPHDPATIAADYLKIRRGREAKHRTPA